MTPTQCTDEWLFPLIDEDGRALLQRLREHPHAPRYTHTGCDRLTAAGLARVRAFEAEMKTAPRGWRPQEIPAWLADFAARCCGDVPFYRRRNTIPSDFFALPTCSRDDLSREPWSFVPDSLPLDDMALYQTSGTTGHPLNILTHPGPLATYIPLVREALAINGVTLEGQRGQVAVVLVCFQKQTWTYVSLSPFLDGAGFVKVNLNPDDWRDPMDRARFLDDCHPQIYTGDPIAFAELARLSLETRPQALVSTAMALLPGWRQQLESHFGCPVVDVYSTNESGPIAVARGDEFELLHHRLYVETLTEDGAAAAPGERGEIVLSGGFNPFLPLLRYRTGDYARLVFRGCVPVLTELEGRLPVLFRGAAGQRINSVDVSNVLKPFALTQFVLHQFSDGALELRVRGLPSDDPRLREAIVSLFGAGQRLDIAAVDAMPRTNGKVVQYTSDLKWSEEQLP